MTLSPNGPAEIELQIGKISRGNTAQLIFSPSSSQTVRRPGRNAISNHGCRHGLGRGRVHGRG